MKFQVALSDLTEALNIVDAAMSSEAADMQGHFLFRKSQTAGRVDVLTHDRWSQASISFVADVEQGDETAFTIFGKGLMNFLGAVTSETPDALMTVDFDTKTSITTVSNTAIPKINYPFGTLGPDAYPDFDKRLQGAKVTGTCRADRLLGALDAAKGFISTDEQRGPQNTVTEFRDGKLMATTLKTLGIIKMPGLDNVMHRIQVGQHLPAVTAFLTACKEDTLEMLEAKEEPGKAAGMFFLRRGDGAVLGWSLYSKPFPKIAQPKAEDDRWWKISPKSLANGLRGVLAAFKGKNEALVRFSRPTPQGPLLLTAATETGRKSEWEIPVLDSGDNPKADLTGMPDSFQLSRISLETLLKAVKDDTITLGLSYRASIKKGYLRVQESRGSEGDEFLFMLAWWREGE